MMKNTIKIITITIGLSTLYGSCHAQRTIALRDFEILKNKHISGEDTRDDGDDITYIKDVNNELNQFVGVWNGSINNRNYEINFVKKTAFKSDPRLKSWDKLIGWITVKDNAGNIIYTNTNRPENRNGFSGDNFQIGTNLYRLNFTGNCYNDSGQAFLKLNTTTGKLQLIFGLSSDMQSDDCPSNFVPVLSTSPSGMLLTKQP